MMSSKAFSKPIMPSRSLSVVPEKLNLVNCALKTIKYTNLEAFADLHAISKSTVQKFKRGDRVSRENFMKLCEILKLDWCELIQIEESKPWEKLISDSEEAKEKLQLLEIDTYQTRLPKAANRKETLKQVKKSQPYEIMLNISEPGYLMLLARDEKENCCCLYPSSEYGIQDLKSPKKQFCLPEANSQTYSNGEALSYEEMGKEWLLAIITKKPLQLSWSQAQEQELQLLNDVQLRELFQELQQHDRWLFHKALLVVDSF